MGLHHVRDRSLGSSLNYLTLATPPYLQAISCPPLQPFQPWAIIKFDQLSARKVTCLADLISGLLRSWDAPLFGPCDAPNAALSGIEFAPNWHGMGLLHLLPPSRPRGVMSTIVVKTGARNHRPSCSACEIFSCDLLIEVPTHQLCFHSPLRLSSSVILQESLSTTKRFGLSTMG